MKCEKCGEEIMSILHKCNVFVELIKELKKGEENKIQFIKNDVVSLTKLAKELKKGEEE